MVVCDDGGGIQRLTMHLSPVIKGFDYNLILGCVGLSAVEAHPCSLMVVLDARRCWSTMAGGVHGGSFLGGDGGGDELNVD